MDAPLLPPTSGYAGLHDRAASNVLPDLAALGLTAHAKQIQPGGEAAARRTLQSFLATRGADYRRNLSSPLAAEDGGSRLSPHLAFGTLSLRAVHQATEARIAALKAEGQGGFAHSLRGFAGRLRWHCHFMQKLEDEPDIEFRNFARSCDGLREGEFDRHRFEAWCRGTTGYPMVDACMRSLAATGWLNFRMRAMLVSFASYQLWLHWRETGLHLARQFVDFEPGIHWSQMQMQSGTTGINTLRIYCPTKQAREQDPQGLFIRRWVPELAGVPLPFLHEPWRMPAEVQQRSGCRIGRDYPEPLVDNTVAMRQAKEKMFALRRTNAARSEAEAVQQRHGSRKSGLPPSSGRAPAPAGGRRRAAPAADPRQASLFDEP
jgi:deoxyribodipyrimidine photo-lyase